MKKKFFLSVAGIACFGFLYSYNLFKEGNTLKADNTAALAKMVSHGNFDSDDYKFWSGSDCEFAGSTVCYIH
ncbi:hypothetical protein [Marinifilum caeruleilacunae]|uniref:NVEALA family protein n=1 Tax=Marinifilum caeruleilacunae TaxID=2499076 RepID=A0ABX1X0U6_9BACT|nr:hypothetical protein [Marinifilum caeruleilacunae]NOU62036.1 hypothetical protein [Marinifilum caeruleilacunae]